MTKILRIKYIDGKRTFTLTNHPTREGLPTGKNSESADLQKWERFMSQNIFNTIPVAGTELKQGDVIEISKYGNKNFYRVIKITNAKVVITWNGFSERIIYEYEKYIPFHGESLVRYRVRKTDDVGHDTLSMGDMRKKMLNKKDRFHKVIDKKKMYEVSHLLD